MPLLASLHELRKLTYDLEELADHARREGMAHEEWYDLVCYIANMRIVISNVEYDHTTDKV